MFRQCSGAMQRFDSRPLCVDMVDLDSEMQCLHDMWHGLACVASRPGGDFDSNKFCSYTRGAFCAHDNLFFDRHVAVPFIAGEVHLFQ